MSINTVPKFSKVVLRRRIEFSEDYDLTTDTYENCGLMITIDEGDASTKGKVYKLSDIFDYKTYN
jgi:hypothetical protein